MLKFVVGALIVFNCSGCAELSKYDNSPRTPMSSAKVYQTSGGNFVAYDRYGNKIVETYRSPHGYSGK